MGYANEFLNEKNDLALEKSNLANSLTIFGVELFSYWSLEKELIWGRSLNIKADDNTNKLSPISPRDIKTLQINKSLHISKSPHDYKYSFSGIENDAYLIVSVPVIKIDGTSPVVICNLIGAKKLNSDYFAQLSKKLHLEIEATNLQQKNVLDKDAEILKQLKINDFYVERVNDEIMFIYSLLKDHESKDLILIKISRPRYIYLQSQETLQFFLYTIIFSTISLVIVIMLLMNQIVLTKLEKLSKVIHNIIKTGSLNEKVPDLGGDEIGEIGVAFNVMLSEIDKLKANAIYNEKMVSLGEMSGGIAHEINNPICIINVSVNLMKLMLQEGIVEPKKYFNQIEIISKTVFRISNIITGLKNISRDTSKEGFINCTFKEIIEDALGVCNEKFKVNGVKIKINLEESIYQIQFSCLRIQMSQVFINLLINSFDAVNKSPNPWVEISAEKTKEGFINIRVKDSGLGIPKEIQNKMFQPFYTTKEIGKGSGLGLSLSNSIIQRHCGELFIDKECINTCFVIKFFVNEVKSD